MSKKTPDKFIVAVDSPATASLLCSLQFALMSQRSFRIGKRKTKQEKKSGSPPKETFLDALFENIRALKVDEKWELELSALAIKAYGAPYNEREQSCLVAMTIIDTLGEKLLKTKKGTTL